MLEVICSPPIAYGFPGTLGSRAKVGAGSVMLAGSRKIVRRYAGIYIGCSVDHYGLLLLFFMFLGAAPDVPPVPRISFHKP